MSTLINLYSIPEMDMSYQNVPDFRTAQLQNDWIAARRKTRLEGKLHVTPSRTSVTVDLSFQQIEDMGIDYCSLIKDDNKIYFYFVADYEYQAAGVTTLILVLDVMQTYMFDHYLLDSFIERCHVNRYTTVGNGQEVPSNALGAENLDVGDFVYSEKAQWDYRPKYVIASTTPLGKNDWARPSGGQGGDEGTDCGDIEKGIISVEGYRFVKGWEGFATKPYTDSAGFVTIGYGITERWQKPIFDKLNHGGRGCTEAEAAEVMYDHLKNEVGKSIVGAFKLLGCTQQYQFDALCSLAFNAGASAVTGKNPVTNAIKADPTNEPAIRKAWEEYKTAGGRERRKQECDIFFDRYPHPPRKIITIRQDGSYGPYVTDNDGNGWMPTCGSDPGGDTFEAAGHKWQYPVRGKKSIVTSLFGKRVHPITGQVSFHYGIDIASKDGSDGLPIYATRPGVVEFSGNMGAAGLTIRINHTDINMRTVFMHNKQLLVKVGQKVKAGDIIAKMGTTGSSTGNHCHYQLERSPFGNPNAINPIPGAYPGQEM